jgi:hypothetical protein
VSKFLASFSDRTGLLESGRKTEVIFEGLWFCLGENGKTASDFATRVG